NRFASPNPRAGEGRRGRNRAGQSALVELEHRTAALSPTLFWREVCPLSRDKIPRAKRASAIWRVPNPLAGRATLGRNWPPHINVVVRLDRGRDTVQQHGG